MIPRELEAKILRLAKAERWPAGTIAAQVGVDRKTVLRVLSQAGVESRQALRPRLSDPYVPFIKETLERYPRLTAARLFEMVKERGYPGAKDHFRSVVARYRPRRAPEAYLRLRTLPAEQAQVDWGHFGHLTFGRARRPLMAFVMVLSYSRRIFLRFFLGQNMGCFLQGHVEALRFFGGVPRVVLYDNLKSAVVDRVGQVIRFNPTLLALSGHYAFEPRPVAVARGNEKGRVERAIRYVRDSFFPALSFRDVDDLNDKALAWCQGPASERRCPDEPDLTVGAAFELERERLLPLPDDDFPCEEQAVVRAGKTPYVRFDLNDYSIPHPFVTQELTVRADQRRVRVLCATDEIAAHPRSWDRGAQVEDPAHISALYKVKQEASEKRGQGRLLAAVPSANHLLVRMAERGDNPGSATAALLRLLDSNGPAELERAIAAALAEGSPRLPSVRHFLDKHRQERGLPPPTPIPLPDERLRDLGVRPADLASYDALTGGEG